MTVQELGAATAGVWTAAQARAAGLSRDRVRGCLERGEWQVLHRGIYTDGGVVLEPLGRAWAAVLAAGGAERATAAARTAARVHGIVLIDDDDPLLRRHDAAYDDVAVPHHLSSRPHLLPRRIALIPADRALVDGCPVTTPQRTLLDLAGILRPDALVCAIDSALHLGLVTAGDLDRLLAVSPGRRDVRRLRRAVQLSDGRAEAPGETLARLLLRPHLPDLQPQVAIFSSTRRLIARLDLGVAALRLGVEVDGRRGHAGDVMLARDRARERRVAPWALERCTWYDLRAAPQPFVERVLRRAAARRGGG